ncbi:MAG: (2Fe-2S)-binding protein [Myxococcales bacterium]|nr:(2Fe-2S)-binding protein [Myxococcales bacterium]
MARRLPGHDGVRGEAVEVRIAGSALRAYADESLAAASLASGGRVLSRSLKYHRPRTFFCFEGHCSGCLVRIGGVPNLRACQAPCTPGAEVVGQNAFPSAEIDLLGAVDFLFSRGMDHHTLMTGSSVLNKLANKVVRQLSGLGKLPDVAAAELPDVHRFDVDVCVIGGGPAGLAAATATSRGGRSTVLVDDQLRPGGSLRTDPRTGRQLAETRWAEAVQAGVTVLARSTAIGFFPEDDGGVLAVAAPDRLYRIYARQWIWATGGYVVNLPFPDNDRPGVIAARAVGRLLIDHGILAGDKICIVEDAAVADDVAALAAALSAAGAEVTRIPLAEVTGTRGRSWASAVDTRRGKLDCDLIAVAATPAPASEGPRQQGCAVVLDEAAGGFRVAVNDLGQTSTPNVWACGDVTGYRGPTAAAADGARVAAQVLGAVR